MDFGAHDSSNRLNGNPTPETTMRRDQAFRPFSFTLKKLSIGGPVENAATSTNKRENKFENFTD
jgi:hypothetical protein